MADVKYEGNAIPYVPPVPVAHPAPLGVAPAPLPYPAPLPAPLIASPPVAPLAPLPPAAPLTPFLHSAPFVHSIPEGPADFSFQGFAPEPGTENYINYAVAIFAKIHSNLALPLTASPIPPSIGPLRHHAPMPDHPLPLPARPLAPLPAVPVDPAPGYTFSRNFKSIFKKYRIHFIFSLRRSCPSCSSSFLGPGTGWSGWT